MLNFEKLHSATLRRKLITPESCLFLSHNCWSLAAGKRIPIISLISDISSRIAVRFVSIWTATHVLKGFIDCRFTHRRCTYLKINVSINITACMYAHQVSPAQFKVRDNSVVVQILADLTLPVGQVRPGRACGATYHSLRPGGHRPVQAAKPRLVPSTPLVAWRAKPAGALSMLCRVEPTPPIRERGGRSLWDTSLLPLQVAL